MSELIIEKVILFSQLPGKNSAFDVPLVKAKTLYGTDLLPAGFILFLSGRNRHTSKQVFPGLNVRIATQSVRLISALQILVLPTQELLGDMSSICQNI
jgi:hypothetical protein